MTVQAYLVPKELCPPWVISEKFLEHYEMVISDPSSFAKLVAMADRFFSKDEAWDLNQARPWSGWPRVYYLSIKSTINTLAFKLSLQEIDHSAADELR